VLLHWIESAVSCNAIYASAADLYSLFRQNPGVISELSQLLRGYQYTSCSVGEGGRGANFGLYRLP
jgi:hypothetical protein